MSGATFAYSSAPLRKVKEVQFGILSPEEIVSLPKVFVWWRHASAHCCIHSHAQKAYSVCKIEFPEVLEEGTGKVKVGGLMDPRLGTVDRNFKCQTCGEGMAECPGHFGHIELARPVFHIGTLVSTCKFPFCFAYTEALSGFLTKVKKILECICVNCGKLKADIVSAPGSDRSPLLYPHPLLYATHLFSGGSLRVSENPKPLVLGGMSSLAIHLLQSLRGSCTSG
jgi:DNA-directed RNA polymerase II subunit RPB1